MSALSTADLTEHAILTYLADSVGASEWLTPGSVAGANFPSGSYTATTTFSLAGFNPTTLNLFLDIAADNDLICPSARHAAPAKGQRRFRRRLAPCTAGNSR